MDLLSSEIVDDFEDFLDDNYDIGEKGRIIDADSACYYIRRVKRNNSEAEKYESLAKELKKKYTEKVDLWLAKRLSVLFNDNIHCNQLLEQYFNDNQSDSKKKIKLPDGTIGFYKNKDKITLAEDETILEFINQNEELQKYIIHKDVVDTKALRKDSVVTEIKDAEGNTNPFLKIGEIVLPTDLASVSLGGYSFSVR